LNRQDAKSAKVFLVKFGFLGVLGVLGALAVKTY
jgi:hypothetical protein